MKRNTRVAWKYISITLSIASLLSIFGLGSFLLHQQRFVRSAEFQSLGVAMNRMMFDYITFELLAERFANGSATGSDVLESSRVFLNQLTHLPMKDRIDAALQERIGEIIDYIDGDLANLYLSIHSGDSYSARHIVLSQKTTVQRLFDLLAQGDTAYRVKTNASVRINFAMLVVAVFVFVASLGLLIGVLEGQRRALRRQADQLRAAVTQVEKASRAKTAFLANMSHELRTPLNAVIGFSEMMVYGMTDPISDRARQYARSICASGQHLLSIINDLLELSRIEAGQAKLTEEHVPAATLMHEAAELLRPIADRRGIAIRVLAIASPVVSVDPRMVRQILINLLSNAVKVSSDLADVQVRLTRAGDASVHIAIVDEGPGMTTEELSIAMEPFGQIKHKPNGTAEGTGLGIPISMTLARLHGGSIRYDTAKGRGTRAILIIPGFRVVADSAHGSARLAG